MIRTYVIISAEDVVNIDFSEVLETSEDTLRYSLDETQTFVKYVGERPSVLDGLTEYTYEEIKVILNGSDWTTEN